MASRLAPSAAPIGPSSVQIDTSTSNGAAGGLEKRAAGGGGRHDRGLGGARPALDAPDPHEELFRHLWPAFSRMRLVCSVIGALSFVLRTYTMVDNARVLTSTTSLANAITAASVMVAVIVVVAMVACHRDQPPPYTPWAAAVLAVWVCAMASACTLLATCDADRGRSAALDEENACRSLAIEMFPGFHMQTANLMVVVSTAVALLRVRHVLLVLIPSYAAWLATCIALGVSVNQQNARYLAGHLSFLTIGFMALFHVEKLGSAKLRAEAMVRGELGRRARHLERQRAIHHASIQAHKATLGYVMHELRNPIHVMAGALWIMRDAWPFNPDHELSAELHALERAVGSCKVLVDDVLDLRRLREGRLTLQPRESRLAGVVRDAVNQVSRISPVPVLMRVRGEAGTVGDVRAVFDSLRVKQVLLNGLTNAVKASEDHAVVVELRMVGVFRTEEGSYRSPGAEVHNAGLHGCSFDGDDLVSTTSSVDAGSSGTRGSASAWPPLVLHASGPAIPPLLRRFRAPHGPQSDVEEKSRERGDATCMPRRVPSRTHLTSGGRGSSDGGDVRVAPLAPKIGNRSGMSSRGRLASSSAEPDVEAKLFADCPSELRCPSWLATLIRASFPHDAPHGASEGTDAEGGVLGGGSQVLVGLVEVKVIDAGVGLQGNDPEHLFEEFVARATRGFGDRRDEPDTEAEVSGAKEDSAAHRRGRVRQQGRVRLVATPARVAPMASPPTELLAVSPPAATGDGPLEIGVDRTAVESLAPVSLGGAGEGSNDCSAAPEPGAVDKEDRAARLHHLLAASTGLGLSLARKLARLLGGDVWLEDRTPDAGAEGSHAARPSRGEAIPAVSSESRSGHNRDVAAAAVGGMSGGVDRAERETLQARRGAVFTFRFPVLLPGLGRGASARSAGTHLSSALRQHPSLGVPCTGGRRTDSRTSVQLSASGLSARRMRPHPLSMVGLPRPADEVTVMLFASAHSLGAGVTAVLQPSSATHSRPAVGRPREAGAEDADDLLPVSAGTGEHSSGSDASNAPRSVLGAVGTSDHAAALPNIATEAAEELRVLVADDERSNRRLLVRMLARCGVTQVEEADDGEAAVELWRSAANEGRPFSLLMLDITMIEVNGDDALRMIFAECAERGLTRPMAVACTGNASISDRTRYRTCGFDSVLPKPFGVGDVESVVKQVLGEGSPDG